VKLIRQLCGVPPYLAEDELLLFQNCTSLYLLLKGSVADLSCLSRILDPDFSIPDLGSRITDKTTEQKRRGKNKLFTLPFVQPYTSQIENS
jgi:hypothetical protein